MWVVGNVESLDQEDHRGRRTHCCSARSHSVCTQTFSFLTNETDDHGVLVVHILQLLLLAMS